MVPSRENLARSILNTATPELFYNFPLTYPRGVWYTLNEARTYGAIANISLMAEFTQHLFAVKHIFIQISAGPIRTHNLRRHNKN